MKIEITLVEDEGKRFWRAVVYDQGVEGEPKQVVRDIFHSDDLKTALSLLDTWYCEATDLNGRDEP